MKKKRADALLYEEELGKERLPVEKNGDTAVIELAGRRYLSASVEINELRDAIQKAVIIE